MKYTRITSLFILLLLAQCRVLCFSIDGTDFLEFGDCSMNLYEKSFSLDCKVDVLINNTATLTAANPCEDPNINWIIRIDLKNDFNNEFEDIKYSSFFSTDHPLYILPTTNDVRFSTKQPWQYTEGILIAGLEVSSQPIYEISFEASDNCGNINTCTIEFDVVDNQKPIPYLIHTLELPDYFEQHELFVSTSDFNIGSFDNCTQSDDLIFTFFNEFPNEDFLCVEHFYPGEHMLSDPEQQKLFLEGKIFKWVPDIDCIGGHSVIALPIQEIYIGDNEFTHNITLWDEKRNAIQTLTSTQIYSNSVGCTTGSLRGVVMDAKGNLGYGFNVQWESIDNELNTTTKTNENGQYFFDGLPELNYTLSIQQNDVPFYKGLNLKDYLELQRTVLNEEVEVDDPYHFIASDIDGDGSINANDLSIFRKILLGIIDSPPGNFASWMFIDASQNLEELDPLEGIRTRINVGPSNLSSDNSYDFVAVKIGNVSCKDLVSNSQDSLLDINSFYVYDRQIDGGEEFSIDIRAKSIKHMLGFQLSIDHEGLEFLNVEQGDQTGGTTDHVIKSLDELVVFQYSSEMIGNDDEEVLFSLNFRANESGKLSEFLQITSTFFNSESYHTDSLVTKKVELIYEEQMTSTYESISSKNELYGCYPNPASHSLTISFDLAHSSEVTFNLWRADGTAVMNKKILGKEGSNNITIDIDPNMANGTYFYSVESTNFKSSSSILVVR